MLTLIAAADHVVEASLAIDALDFVALAFGPAHDFDGRGCRRGHGSRRRRKLHRRLFWNFREAEIPVRSPEEEIEAVLPAELLAALDEGRRRG